MNRKNKQRYSKSPRHLGIKVNAKDIKNPVVRMLVYLTILLAYAIVIGVVLFVVLPIILFVVIPLALIGGVGALAYNQRKEK